MKTLYLVRHAKSEWKNERLQDQYRPLNERGYADAVKMSLALKQKRVQPDLVISSPAIRAYSTAFIFCSHFDYDPAKMLIKPELYESTTQHYLDVIGAIDDRYSCVFLFAHNPTISDCANRLTEPFTDSVPTCAITGIRGGDSWKAFAADRNELLLFDYPKNGQHAGG